MNLKKLFNPSSIAVVGVSHETDKVGYLTVKNIMAQGYKGKLYLINNKYKGKILGSTVYPSLSSINRAIDTVIFAVPGRIALSIIEEMVKLKIKNAVIYAAGFKETAGGQILETQLSDKAKQNNLNILGPNCLGFVNTALGINATFLKNNAPSGNIGFISQSGALGSYLCDYFSGHINLGFSYFISLGNKTVIDEADALEFLAGDKNTQVIAMYLEDIKNGDKFRKSAEKISKVKPIIVLKSGMTSQGSQAALSHTGGMIGDDQVYETIFWQSGVMRARTLGEFLTILKCFSYNKIPSGKSVLVLSNAGGAGVMLTDELVKNKLELATISEKTIKNITKSFDATRKISVRNPIDLLGDASAFDYKMAIEATIKEKDIGSVIVLLTPQANTEITKTADVIVRIQKHFSHPIYPIFMGKKSVGGVGRNFEENKIAGFANFDFLPKAISKMYWWKSNIKKNGLSSVLTKLNKFKVPAYAKATAGRQKLHIEKTGALNLIESMEVIKLSGISIEPIYLATSVELKNITDKTGFPVVAKIISDKISHKTEVGGVIVNIKDLKELQIAFKKLLSLQYSNPLEYKVGVQKMVKGNEILVGAKRDSSFGPVVLTGLGGVYTELLKEISYLVYPFTYRQFVEKIKETKLGKLASGFRGSPPIDLEKLYDIADKIGRLMKANEKIKEIDINPLIISGSKITAVDARIII